MQRTNDFNLEISEETAALSKPEAKWANSLRRGIWCYLTL